MPTPENPPLEPTYGDCFWSTPRTVCVFPTGFQPPPNDYTINPATGTYCPPYTVSGGVVAGYETYTEECENCNGFGQFKNCHDPDFAAGVADAEGTLGELPACSYGWEYEGCAVVGSNSSGEIFQGRWAGTCPSCPPGYDLNEADCLCYDGDPCPEGTFYCFGTGECVTTELPDCPGVSGCVWDANLCVWVCDGTPTCADDERYDFDLCACVNACGAGECFCELSQTCVDCAPPEGSEEEGCEWNRFTCEFDCHECPDGQCWCNVTETCVDCPDPDCKEALHCVWSPILCEWVCDDPEVKCGGRAWLGEPDCRCEAGGGSDLAELNMGWLVRAYCVDNTVYVGTSRTAGVTWDDVEVAAGESGTSAPALTRDRFDTLWVAWHTGSGLSLESVLYRSPDLGATWELIYTIAGRSYPRPCSTPERLLFISHTGAAQAITASEDGGVTFGASIHDVFTDAEERRADLRLDRRGLLHVAYEDIAGNVFHRWSEDGGATWDAGEVWTADGVGAEVGYSVGTERGFFTHFDEGALVVATTDESLSHFQELAAAPLPEYQPQQLGTLTDRRGYPWVLGLVDEAPVVVLAENIYVEWVDPV